MKLLPILYFMFSKNINSKTAPDSFVGTSRYSTLESELKDSRIRLPLGLPRPDRRATAVKLAAIAPAERLAKAREVAALGSARGVQVARPLNIAPMAERRSRATRPAAASSSHEAESPTGRAELAGGSHYHRFPLFSLSLSKQGVLRRLPADAPGCTLNVAGWD